MWVSPGFIASNIRFSALDQGGNQRGASTMDEQKMMTPEQCAELIAKGVEARKRTVVMSFQGKQTVFLNRFFPGITDKLVRAFYFKEGKLVK
jgi:short-subunit dehydrogenase